MATGGDLNTSLSDYVAMRAAGMPSGLLGEGKDYNPYNNQDLGDWLSILGYNAGYMDSYNDNDKEYYSAFGDKECRIGRDQESVFIARRSIKSFRARFRGSI